MCSIGDDADVDAVGVMRFEKIFEHHGAPALAPFRTILAVERPEIVRRLFRRIDVCMPIDDHALSPVCATPAGLRPCWLEPAAAIAILMLAAVQEHLDQTVP